MTAKNAIVTSTGNKGKGVFAAKNFRKGEIVLEIKGPVISKRTVHSVQVGTNFHIDPKPPARFANHSCDPNCGVKVDKNDHIYLCAMKRIRKGAEITWDYTMSDYKFHYLMPCFCGSKNCRKFIGGYVCLDKKKRNKYKNFLMPYLKKMPQKMLKFSDF